MIQIDAQGMADGILADIKNLSKQYWSSWSDAEKKLVEVCVLDASQLALRAVAGEDIAVEKNQVDAQLMGIKVAGKGTAKDIVWTYVVRTVHAVVTRLI